MRYLQAIRHCVRNGIPATPDTIKTLTAPKKLSGFQPIPENLCQGNPRATDYDRLETYTPFRNTASSVTKQLHPIPKPPKARPVEQGKRDLYRSEGWSETGKLPFRDLPQYAFSEIKTETNEVITRQVAIK